MPTYGPQLQAFRDIQLDPVNTQPLYNAIADRQNRLDTTQAQYDQYIQGVVKDQTLDPVTKQKRLDGLRNNVHELYSQYDGDVAAARDDVLNMITDNRKDPYWQLDKARTEGFNNMRKYQQEMSSQGKIPLFRDYKGNFVSDPMDQFSSLTDSTGQYVDPKQFNVTAEQQLDYEAPFVKMFSTVKPSEWSSTGFNPSTGDLAKYIAGYLQTGSISSPNKNLDRVLKNSVDQFVGTVEGKQFMERWGSAAPAKMASMAANVADRYRYTKQQQGSASQVRYPKENNPSSKLKYSGMDKVRTGVSITGSEKLLQDPKYTDIEGNSVSFADKYSTLNKTLGLGYFNSTDLKPQLKEVITPENPESPVQNRTETKFDIQKRLGAKIADSDLSSEDKAATIAELGDFLNENEDLESFIKESTDYKNTVDSYKLADPRYDSMKDSDVIANINSQIMTGQGEPVHAFPNSAITALGGQDLFKDDNKEGSDATGWRNWRGKIVYKREKGDTKWTAVPKDEDTERRDLYNDTKRSREETNIYNIPDKGTAYYAEGDEYEVAILTPTRMNEAMKPLSFLEKADKTFRTSNLNKMYEVGNINIPNSTPADAIDVNVAVIRSAEGPLVLNFKNANQAQIKKYLDNLYTSNNRTKLAEILDQGIPLDDYYNEVLRKIPNLSESSSNTKE